MTTTNNTNYKVKSSKEIDFVIKNLWLFEKETIERVEEVNKQIDIEMSHKHFNHEFIPTDNNTTIFHPIDEEDYNDQNLTKDARKSAMTLDVKK